MDCGEKTEKTWKIRHKHCMTQNMAKNTQKREEHENAHCRTGNFTRKLINEENEKLTLQDLEYGEKTDK